ncbi:MAG TPA: hypothetical protein VK707_05300 [Solirubrobacteraceae bacterium]|nr:hypothetical protein [Solirubrobacteraceae bacterium]
MSSSGELQMELAVVGCVSGAFDQAGGLCALGKLDGAVVAYVQRVGCVADRWSSLRDVAAHDEQELVERWREAARSGSLFAPSCEGAQLGAEGEHAAGTSWLEFR